MKRYVIVGMGAAGIGAAEVIRRQDPQGEIVCVSAEPEGYYSRPGLAYYLSKELSRRSLYPFTAEDFQRRNIKVITGRAEAVDAAGHEVMFSDGKRLKYDRLLLAPGAKAVRPQVEGEHLDGVVYLDSIAQTNLMIKKARWAKSAVVVGGGITALEIVEGLSARGVKVHFFLRGERYWSRVLDSIESQLVLNRLNYEGVEIHKNTELERIIEKSGKVYGVVTNDGRKIKADMVGFAIGVRPRITLAENSGLEVGRGVRVNHYMQTSGEDVFAAGDAAEQYDPDSGRWVVDSLWYLARHQGMAAGMSMVGQQQAYRRGSPLNITRLAGITTTIIGRVGSEQPDEDELAIVRGESQTWQELPDAVVCQNNFEINRLRVMVGKQYLLGALLMGDQSLSQPLEELVANQVDISEIRPQLLQRKSAPGPVLLDFWNRWRSAIAN